jgi:hypothetical protein
MRWWLAILFTLALYYFTAALTRLTDVNLFLPLLIVTAIWAAIDSSKIKLSQYKSGMP